MLLAGEVAHQRVEALKIEDLGRTPRLPTHTPWNIFLPGRPSLSSLISQHVKYPTREVPSRSPSAGSGVQEILPMGEQRLSHHVARGLEVAGSRVSGGEGVASASGERHCDPPLDASRRCSQHKEKRLVLNS